MFSLSNFDFMLPDDLVAAKPLEHREASRMLIVDRSAGSFDDDRFQRLPEILRRDDLLVLNNTKVFPARLHGKTETGGNVEVFLVRDLGDGVWETLARPAKRLKAGRQIIFDEFLTAEALDRGDDGKVVVRFSGSGDLIEQFERIGRTPLPPYIKRGRDDIDTDRERYQTVYAKNRGAIAAPTAGLHFTPDILGRLRDRGIEIAEITLHVGYGTFEPVRSDDLSKHSVLPEQYEIGQATAEILNIAKQAGRRIIAVGTTTTRTLEYNFASHGEFVAGSGFADLTILPGFKFAAIDGLLTNFHLPKSSLLVLVSTFGGHELIMEAYRHAVASRYRFYSYGDCMLIV
ncbi:tRNA preQ1(34) S-adenosylmethionine ribosyltransferase-isomerase QueA [soil metagenome]